jgi:hypothetical protein
MPTLSSPASDHLCRLPGAVSAGSAPGVRMKLPAQQSGLSPSASQTRDGDWLNPAEGNAPYEIELRRSFEFQKNGLCLWSRIIDMPTKMSMFFIDCEIASLL